MNEFVSLAGTHTSSGLGPHIKVPAGGALFNLANDTGETKNVADQHPDRLRQMSEKLKAIVQAKRTRP